MSGRYVGSRLFLSCDLVGSTRRKQNGSDDESWISVFLEFYRLFPALFREELAKQVGGASLTPSLWKAVGDELLFVCDVQHEDDVHALVTAWLAAMTTYEAELDREGLSTKGSAFIATFPDPDREVRIARELGQSLSTMPAAEADNEKALIEDLPDHLEDFLGPSIDTGFRVMSRASHRYFTISVEVAWSYAAHHVNAQTNAVALVLFEEAQLKGVWGERAYPVFAIDRQQKELVNQKLAKVRGDTALDMADVCGFCEACVSTPDWPSALHLPGSDEAKFRTAQVRLDQRAAELNNLHDALQSWPEQSQSAAASGAANEAGGDELPADAPDT